MTRSRDLLPPNPLTCRHEHPSPVVDDETGKLLFWKCECGRSFSAGQFANKDKPADGSLGE